MPSKIWHIVVTAKPDLGNVARAAKQQGHRGAVPTIIVDQICPASWGHESLRRAIDLIKLVHDRVRVAIDRIDRVLRGDHPANPRFQPKTGIRQYCYAKPAP